jgi:tetratricopeptide (TPR) repeat protein
VKRADVALALEWGATGGAAALWIATAQWRDQSPITGVFVAPSGGTLVAGLALLAIGLTARWGRTGRLLPRTAFDWPLLLLLLGTLAGWLVAYDRELGTLKLCTMVGAVAIFYVLAGAGRLVGGRVAAVFVLAAAALAVVFPTQHDYQAAPADMAWLTQLGLQLEGLVPRLRTAGTNPHLIAGVLVMAVPFNLAWIRHMLRPGDGKGRWRAVVPVLALLALGFGLLMTSSRQAWIALGAAGALWVVVWVGRRLAERWGAVIAGSVALVAGLALYGAAVARPELVAGLPGANVALGRAALYRDTFYLGTGTLFTGAGLGAYEMNYSTYSLLLHVGFLPHAHQWFLQTWMETGLLGLVGLLWLIGGAAWFAVRDRTAAEERPWFRSGAAWAVAVIAIHGLFDAPLTGARIALIALVPFGLLLAGRSQEEAAARLDAGATRRQRAGILAVALVLIVAAVAWWRPLLGAAYANAGAIEQARAELADYDWPRWPMQDEIRRTANLDGAISAYTRALELDPGNATANRRLGMIELAREAYEAALAHLERAYAATPGDVATRQLLGEAYIVNGRLEEGEALWATLERGQGQLEARVWWYGHLGDEEREGWIREVADRVGG